MPDGFLWLTPCFPELLDLLLTGQNDSSKSRAITNHHVQSQGTACTEQHVICFSVGVLQTRILKQVLWCKQPYLNLAILCKLMQVLAAQLWSASLQNLFFPCCGFSTVSRFCLKFLLRISCSEVFLHAFNLLEEEAVEKHQKNTSLQFAAWLKPPVASGSPKVTQDDATPCLSLTSLLKTSEQWRCNVFWRYVSLTIPEYQEQESIFQSISSCDVIK